MQNEKSRDRNARLTYVQTSSPYNRAGKHLHFDSSRITSSDASLPTLAKMLYAARKNERFASSV